MTFLLLAAAAAIQAAPAPAAKSAAVQCPRSTSYRAFRSGEALKPQKLTELPSANMYSAVYRHDERGCESPIVIRYKVGR